MTHERGACGRIITAAVIALAGFLSAPPASAQGRNVEAPREVLRRADLKCLYADDRGFLWLCTPEGIVRFDGRNQVTFPQRGLTTFASTYDGRLWAGGASGLFEFWREAPAGANPFIRIPGSENVTVNALLGLPTGELAVGTDRGVMQVTAHTLTPLRMNGATMQGIAEPVRSIFNIAPHRFAAGTSNGVYLLLGDGRTVHLTTADGLPDNEVVAFAQAFRVGPYPPIWVGTKRGIAVIDWHGLERGLTNVVSTLPSSDPVSRADIRALRAGRSLWIATTTGTFVRESYRIDEPRYSTPDVPQRVRSFEGTSDEPFVLTDSGVSDLGLTNMPPKIAIMAVRVDGVTRIAPASGVRQVRIAIPRRTRLIEVEFASPRTEYRLRHCAAPTCFGSAGYQVKAGYLRSPDDEFSDLPPARPAVHQAGLSADKGLPPVRGAVFVPLPRPLAQLWRGGRTEVLGPVVVRRTLNEGPPTAFASAHVVTADATGWLRLPDGVQNRIVIEHPSRTLDAGLYRLVVHAGDFGRTGDSATVLLTVPAPLWVQRWFVAPLAVTAVGALVAFRWQRERSRRQIAGVRARIAADLHDSVGASLSRIALLSEVAQQQVAGQLPAAAQSVRAIGNSARSVIDEMNDAVWFIDPGVRNVGQMLVRIRTVAATLFEAYGIHWTVDATTESLHVDLSSDDRRHLYLLIKEALTNARRHARPATVTVRVSLPAEGLRVEIEDDGVGHSGHSSSGGNGVRNMRARASALGGTLIITPRQATSGTHVLLQTRLRGREG